MTSALAALPLFITFLSSKSRVRHFCFRFVALSKHLLDSVWFFSCMLVRNCCSFVLFIPFLVVLIVKKKKGICVVLMPIKHHFEAVHICKLFTCDAMSTALCSSVGIWRWAKETERLYPCSRHLATKLCRS